MKKKQSNNIKSDHNLHHIWYQNQDQQETKNNVMVEIKYKIKQRSIQRSPNFTKLHPAYVKPKELNKTLFNTTLLN